VIRRALRRTGRNVGTARQSGGHELKERYELDDGVLVVSPAPMVIHQVVLPRLIAALVTACPAAGGGNRTTPAWRDPGCRRDRL